MGKTITVKPLDVIERKSLRGAEAVIEKHLGTFFEVGQALLDIRDGNLYRDTHKTFEAYYRDRWGFDKSYAYRLIDATTLLAKMSPTGDILPANERQARALVGLAPEAAKDVMKEVVEEAKEAGVPVTAAAIRQKREQFKVIDEPYVEPPEAEEEEEEPEPSVEEAMAESNRVLEGLARAITAMGKEPGGGPHLLETSRIGTVQGQLRAAAGTVRAAKGYATCTYDGCNGDGCGHCEQTGWLTKTAAESAPRP